MKRLILLFSLFLATSIAADLSYSKTDGAEDSTFVIGNEKYIIFGKMEYIRISNNDASFSVTMVHRFR